MFKVYILYSAKKDKYYVGQTEDLERRLAEHNMRKNLGASDWDLKYHESFGKESWRGRERERVRVRERKSQSLFRFSNLVFRISILGFSSFTHKTHTVPVLPD